MNDRLRRVLPLPLRKLIRHIRFGLFDGYATRSYAQEGEDMVLRRIFESRKVGFYVDVGAHHPQRFSNTNYFYRRGWRGINIDANPESERQFQRWRQRDTNLLCGVSDMPGEFPYYRFEDPALNTFSKELADRREQQGYSIVATDVIKVARLDSIFSKHLSSGTEIDFLTVDAEGHDLNVIRSNDWTRWRPRCVVVEALGSSIVDVLRGDIHEFLSSVGYVFFAKTYNSTFFLDESWYGKKRTSKVQ